MPTTAIPQVTELTQRLEPILPLIAQHAASNHQQRDVAPDVVAELVKAGLFRCYQPRRWGGYESDPRTLFALQNQIAQHCASTGWIFGVLSVQAFVLALMDEQAQADVWGQNPLALMSSSFMPVGKVTVVDGGFQLTGQWSFSSGCNHADWAIIGGLVPSAEAGKPPAMTLFLVPRSDYQIVDTWDTFGLRGTGSHDIRVQDAFVPAYRTYQPSPGLVPNVAATELSPLYRLPWLYLFTCSVSNIGIGIAQGALKAFLAIERVRVSSFTGKPAKEEPGVVALAARMSAEIDAAEAMYVRHLDNMLGCIEGGCAMPQGQGLLQRTQLTGVLRKLAAMIDEMQLMLGGRGIRNDSPLTPIWLDMLAARAHPGNNPEIIAASYGSLLIAEG